MQRGEVTWLSGLKSQPRPTMHPQLPVHRHQQHRGERGHWAKRARLHPPCPSGQRCGTTPKGTGRGRWPFPSPASGPFFQDLLSRKACRLSSGNPSCAVSHHQSEQSRAKPPPCPHCHRLPEMRCHCLLPAGTKGHPPTPGAAAEQCDETQNHTCNPDVDAPWSPSVPRDTVLSWLRPIVTGLSWSGGQQEATMKVLFFSH